MTQEEEHAIEEEPVGANEDDCGLAMPLGELPPSITQEALEDVFDEEHEGTGSKNLEVG